MSNIFSNNEEEILKLKIKGKLNREIAEALNKSEAYISQTLKSASVKINELSGSIDLLNELGVVQHSDKHFTFNESGKKRLEESLKRVRDKIVLQKKSIESEVKTLPIHFPTQYQNYQIKKILHEEPMKSKSRKFTQKGVMMRVNYSRPSSSNMSSINKRFIGDMIEQRKERLLCLKN